MTNCSNFALDNERTKCFGTPSTGIIYGKSQDSDASIRVDQGIDSSEVNPQNLGLMQGLSDSIYIIQMDNRLGQIVTEGGANVDNDYVDDDEFAFYTVGSEQGVVTNNTDSLL